MSTSSTTTEGQEQLSSSILLWMRTDQPRQTGMDYWKGPHSGIISANPGLKEYRQIHLAEDNPGRWPTTQRLETAIPADRRIDGIAEVTLKSVLSTLQGRKQNAMAFKDEINVFRRTLLYAGLPNTSRWYDVAAPGEAVGSRARPLPPPSRWRRRTRVPDVRQHAARVLAGRTGALKELRTQTFLPWSEKLWDTPERGSRQPRGPTLPRLGHARIRR